MAKYTNVDLIFKDRTEAGKMLAEKLFLCELQNPIVIGLPRGGVEVAKPIADCLGAKLDIMVSKKIGAPGNPELAIGAVTSHGDYVISSYSDEMFQSIFFKDEKKWGYLQSQIVYLVNECKEREKKYLSCRGGVPSRGGSASGGQTRPYEGRNIILVDDGTATGMTAQAAIKSIKKQNPTNLILAIPVISSQAYDEIKDQVNKIETLKIPRDFVAVSIHFQNFEPVTDDEIKAMLV